MQTRSRVRRHLTSAEKDEILRSCQRSPLTRKQFAAQVGIGVSTLQAWLRKAAVNQGGNGSGFLQAPNLLSVSSTPPSYRIQWPGGLSLEVRSGFVDAELSVLLAALATV